MLNIKNGNFFLNVSNSTPLDQVYSKEFLEALDKAGSCISMLENKKINTATLFVLLIENKEYQDFFTKITSTDSFREAVFLLLLVYPNLVKSKITKSTLKKNLLPANDKRRDSARKTVVQQTSSSIKKAKKQTLQTKAKL
jgi:hypothetical protein